MHRSALVVVAALLLLTPAAAFAQFVQQGPKLVDGNAPLSVAQGSAVAISADGNTAVVGGPVSATGAAWVYTRSLGIWTQQGPRLVPDSASSGANFGQAVAISGDGNTIIVGGPDDDHLNGGAWIFVRTNGAWTQQGPKLLGSNAAGLFHEQGWAVALSADGNTALSSAPTDSSFKGATWVFVRTAGTWSQQGSKLVGGGATGESWQGVAVALSGDGNTALIGGKYDNNGAGAAWIFTRSGSTWTQQGAKLTASDRSGVAFVGEAVALSADGSVAAIGGSGDNSNVGAAWIFTRTGSTWAQRGSKLVGTGAIAASFQGRSVSLSGDATTLLVGGPESDATGAAWVFRKKGGSWSQAGSKLVGSGSIGVAHQGEASALSSDGRTIIVGGWNDATSLALGASWIFAATDDQQRAGDRDGDLRSDLTVYHGPSGMWSTITSASGFTDAIHRGWGGSGYAPVPGDYDGDGRTDLGVYHESSGNWYVLLSSANFTTSLSKSVGGPGWVPVPGDYDGDGTTDIVVYNTSSGQWYGLESGTHYSTTLNLNWGGDGYQAVPGDFDGDERADIAVYQIASGNWYVLPSSSNYTTSLAFSVGGSGWTAVPADYDGDGKADIVVYNNNTGQWYGLTSSGNYATVLNVMWGGSGYQPIKGDYDGDGRADLATYVTSTGAWYILLSGANYTTVLAKNWGGADYLAVPQYP